MKSFRNVLLSLVIALMVGGHAALAGLVPLGGSTPVVGAGFTPQTGFGFSGSTSPGGSMTITSTGSVFGTKPYSGQPLVWAPMDTDMNGSALGRISGSSTWLDVANLTWQSGCGPSGAGGCAYGGTTKGDGSTGTLYKATGAVDLDEWSGWASQNGGLGYYLNDYGAQLYVWRDEYHVGYGHLDSTGANSYNSIGTYNAKNFRIWSRIGASGSAQAYPDIYWGPHNQRLVVESCPGSNCAPSVTNGAPVQYTTASSAGSPDVNGSVSAQQAFDGMTSGSGAYNRWATAEFYFKTNTCTTGPNCYAGSSAPDSQFWYWVVGYNSNSPVESYPYSNYQNSTPGVAWMFTDSGSVPNGGHGTMLRIYPMHLLVDGTSGCPGSCSADMPLNAYINYGPIYVDDCWCHIVVQDSATYNSATAREIQIPATWASGSITMTLRSGSFGNLHGKYLFVIDSANSAHYIGQFTKIDTLRLMNAANDDLFETKAVA